MHAWNVHRPERSHCASSSCDFSQSQFFVTYTHTGRKIKPTHLQWWQCPQTNTAPSCFFFMWFLTVSIFFLFVYNTMSPSLQMNMNCHVHVLLSECMLALLASAWNVHRPERSHCDTEGEVNVKVIQGQTSLMKWISLKRETGSLRKLCKWWTTMFREERDLQEIIAFVNVTTC